MLRSKSWANGDRMGLATREVPAPSYRVGDLSLRCARSTRPGEVRYRTIHGNYRTTDDGKTYSLKYHVSPWSTLQHLQLRCVRGSYAT